MKPRPHVRTFSPPQPSIASIAQRIRLLRHERGWTLADVETLSKGSIKAAVLGSYERSDRAMSLSRVIELAELFSVPLTHLLSAPEVTPTHQGHPPLMVDLRRAKAIAKDEPNEHEKIFLTFMTFINWIAGRRCDWNGEIMSLRDADLPTLSLMTFTAEGEFIDWLNSKRLLITGPNRP